MINCGAEILRPHGLVLHVRADLVGLPVDHSAADAAAGDDGRNSTPASAGDPGLEPLRLIRGVRPNSPVTTTRVRSSKPRSVQVDEQSRKGFIEPRQAPAHAVGTAAKGAPHSHFAAVHVPTRTGRSDLRIARSGTGPAVDGDKSDSRFDEPSGEEQILSQRVHSVPVADGDRFPLELERLAAGLVHSSARTPVRANPANPSERDFPNGRFRQDSIRPATGGVPAFARRAQREAIRREV